MIRPMFILFAGVLIQQGCIASAETAYTYLSRALDAETGGPIYQYDIEYSTADEMLVARVDPSKAQGERITILSPPSSKLSADIRDELKDLEANPLEDFWCARVSELVPEDARLKTETQTTATYEFRPLPTPGDPDDAKIMKHLIGVVSVSKQDPQVLSLSLSAPRPFKPVWIAKINRFELSLQCDRAPDGRTHMQEFRVSIDGKAALQSFYERERRTIYNIKPVDLSSN